jgi:hypothetical protein
MHGNVPFGMPSREAAKYAHAALDTANKGGTGFMMWLMQLVMQMLIDLMTRHHEKHSLKDYEAVIDRLTYLEDWSKKRYQELEADQGDSGQITELGKKMDSLMNGVEPFTPPSPEKQREIALKLKAKYEEKPENRKKKKWDNDNNLEM